MRKPTRVSNIDIESINQCTPGATHAYIWQRTTLVRYILRPADNPLMQSLRFVHIPDALYTYSAQPSRQHERNEGNGEPTRNECNGWTSILGRQEDHLVAILAD